MSPTDSALPPFFVVNLERSKQRRAHMIKLMTTLGVSYEFIEAVDGQKLSEQQIKQVYDDVKARQGFGRSLTQGEIATCLSHKKIYKKIVQEKIPKAFILEDDVKFYPAFLPIFKAVLSLNQPYEIILFAHGNSKAGKTLIKETSFRGKISLSKAYSLIRFWGIGLGALGYLVTYSAARKLLKAISPPELLFKPIDCYTGDPRFINLYGLQPILIEEAPIGLKNSTLANARNKAARQESQIKGFRAAVERLLIKLSFFRVIKLYYFFKAFYFRFLAPPPTPKK